VPKVANNDLVEHGLTGGMWEGFRAVRKGCKIQIGVSACVKYWRVLGLINGARENLCSLQGCARPAARVGRFAPGSRARPAGSASGTKRDAPMWAAKVSHGYGLVPY